MKINRDSAAHYTWKEVCDGWHLVQGEDLSVIAEKMPPHTWEDNHYHQKSRQFFYLLAGQATMVVDGQALLLQPGDGVEIPPGHAHQMRNDSGEAVEFLVVSAPKSHGDKVVLP